MALHYEWWSKAGGGPGYENEMKREVYVKTLHGLKIGLKGIFLIRFRYTLWNNIYECSSIFSF